MISANLKADLWVEDKNITVFTDTSGALCVNIYFCTPGFPGPFVAVRIRDLEKLRYIRDQIDKAIEKLSAEERSMTEVYNAAAATEDE